MALQVFMSYARDDDFVPPGSDSANGFVSALHHALNNEFRPQGPPRPKLWQDNRNIEASGQFDPIIKEAIDASGLLLVVLSRNWLDREYCRLELDLFEQRWRREGQDAVKGRIIVVGKQHIDPKQRPSLLQGQQGYRFYSFDGDEEVGAERDFFKYGRVRSEFRDDYDYVLEKLAKDLWRRAQVSEQSKQKVTPPKGLPPSRGRKIYVAKPAADMRAPYLRMVDELSQRGYLVTPDANADIPNDTTAVAFIDDMLDGAELSVHLLGDKAGYAPEDEEPIVKLQLARAAEHAMRRLIWAPKRIVDLDGLCASEESRDPLSVLAKFGSQLETDKVDGSALGKFVEFVVQHLEQTAPQATLADSIDAIESNARVYIYHQAEDSEYAVECAKALQERQIEPVLPALQGDTAEIKEYDTNALRDCDAVLLCWARASEVWVKSMARKLRNWRDLGREKRFACRGLVAGPPLDRYKGTLMQIPPRSEIDVVLDLTAYEKPTAEALDPLIRAAAHAEAAASPAP